MSNQWCPNCGAMLPDHLETCPRCQTKLNGGDSDSSGFKAVDIMNISLTMALFIIIPLVLFAVIGLICAYTL